MAGVPGTSAGTERVAPSLAVSSAVVSDSHDDAAADGRDSHGSAAPPGQADHDRGGQRGARERLKLSRRGWTVLLSAVLVVVFVLLGTLVRVPYVVLGPGPTFNTLGKVDGSRVVQVDGHKTYPAAGELRMVTVSFSDEVTLFGALGMWLSGRYALAPREAYFQQGETEKEFRKHSQKLFRRSQSNAELAALHQLGYPTNVFVDSVMPDTPAASQAKATFTAGEQIIAVNGTKVSSIRELQNALSGSKAGETVSITVLHEGAEKTMRVTLAQGPHSERSKGFIGIKLAERAAVPFDVDVTLDEVGGPSAGMMFSLAIVDRLTEGSLTGGRTIAGTGTIDPGGNVGRIGGISFKLVAAKEAGAEVFLVPAGNCATAAETAPDGLKLIKVGTLDDAVNALKDLKAGKPVPTCSN